MSYLLTWSDSDTWKICSPEIVELQFFPLGEKLAPDLSDNVPLEKWRLGWVLAPTSSMKLGNPVWGATLSPVYNTSIKKTV